MFQTSGSFSFSQSCARILRSVTGKSGSARVAGTGGPFCVLASRGAPFLSALQAFLSLARRLRAKAFLCVVAL